MDQSLEKFLLNLMNKCSRLFINNSFNTSITFSLVLFFLLQYSVATNLQKKPQKVKVKENHKDIIKKAQNLSLQRDRIQVSNLLRKAIDDEAEQKKIKELKSQLKKLLEFFYSEKAIQSFQLGESLAIKDPTKSISYLEKALEVEPRNLKILKKSAFVYLETSRCEDSFRLAQQAYGLNPYDIEVLRLNFQALACLQDVENFKAFDMSLQSSWKIDDIYFLIALAKIQSLQEQDKEAMNTIQIIKLKSIGFAPVYLLEAKLLIKKGRNPETSYQSYLDKCQNLTNAKKEFPFQAQLCSQADEVNAKLAKLKEVR